MAKYIVEMLVDHVVVRPATVLETRLTSDGPVVSTIDVPASEYKYTKGQRLTFRNKKDLNAFLQRMGEKAKLI